MELQLTIEIDAPPERCFDLARSMNFHLWSMRGTGETISSGRHDGLIGLGEQVEFRGKHLGVWRTLAARVTQVARPSVFVDEQVRGPFESFRHEHRFDAIGARTRLTDRIDFRVRPRVPGIAWLVERLIVRPHLRRVIGRHQQNLKDALEGGGWAEYLLSPADGASGAL